MSQSKGEDSSAEGVSFNQCHKNDRIIDALCNNPDRHLRVSLPRPAEVD